jgi:hypothetical protein
MKSIRQIRFKTPMFHWLFFLLLSTGFSYFQESPSIGKLFAVEFVHRDTRIFGNTKHIAKYPVSSQKRITLQNHSTQSLKINILSRTLNSLVKVAFIKQAAISSFLPQHTIIHFQRSTLCSGDDDAIS